MRRPEGERMGNDQRYASEIDRLFQEGTIVGLDEGALLERISSGHDEVRAFGTDPAARTDGPRSVPPRAFEPARRRGRLPGDVPNPGATGARASGSPQTGAMAACRCLSRRRPRQV